MPKCRSSLTWQVGARKPLRCFRQTLQNGKKLMIDDPKDVCPGLVEIGENSGEWFVRVLRAGTVQVTTFDNEGFARSFARWASYRNEFTPENEAQP
jgi:hypothetical protein